MNRPRIAVMLIGPSDSGKKSQAKRIARMFGFKHFDMEATLRLRKHADTLPERLLEIMSNNEPIPDKYVEELVTDQIISLPHFVQGIVFDGLPRNSSQACSVLESLRGNGIVHNLAIFFKNPNNQESLNSPFWSEIIKFFVTHERLVKKIDVDPTLQEEQVFDRLYNGIFSFRNSLILDSEVKQSRVPVVT